MDISFWTNCNPKVTLDHTVKKFYGKFLYKLVLYCPAGRSIDNKGVIDQELLQRRNMQKSINPGGWWGRKMNRDLDHADVDLLIKMREVRRDTNPGLKLRVEEPLIQIYAESEQILQNFVNTHLLPEQKQHVTAVSGPASATAADMLNNGAILRKENNGYQYKIILKDGRYTPTVKQNILQYLDNQGEDQVLLSRVGREMLSKSTSFVWGFFFYANDLSIITFLNLISPGIVSNYHELIVLDNK